jgi:isovaleryl-CoA dehydrogenase
VTSPLSPGVQQLRARGERVAAEVLLPAAEELDRDATWPAAGMRALADAGLLGLHVPARLGGHEHGLVALAALTETLGKACPSTALCFGMHCVGTAVITAKATRYHEDRYLAPIAAGAHVTTLALSETGTGAHFYMPRTRLTRAGDQLELHGAKAFVTSGEHADSYVVSTAAIDAETGGEFSCVVVDRNAPGMIWQEPWHGFGMRGNASRGVKLDQTRVPAANLLGADGDQIWYVFEVVAPYFLIAMAGTYLGIAQAALDVAHGHLQTRRHEASGERLADIPLLQHRFSGLWTAVEKSRLLVHHAARLGDAADPEALPALLACKADVAEVVVEVTNEAMTLCGGVAYRENAALSRMLRDARAAHVMSPTTDLLRQWTGRALFGLPLL